MPVERAPDLAPNLERDDPWGERLTRHLGVGSAMAVVIGSTIGSGIFRTPASVAGRIDDLRLFALAWLLGSAVALAGALSYAELSAMMPRSGGIYVYLRRAFGPLWAFLFGWAQLVVLRPAAYGAIGITSAGYLWRTFGVDGTAPLLGLPLSLEQATAVVLIGVVAWVNIRGIRSGAWVQNVSTVLKMGALVVLVLLGLYVLVGGAPRVAESYTPLSSKTTADWITAFGLAMVPILWSYDGWSDVGYVSGEVVDPQTTLPRAFVLGTATVGALYLAANAAYLFVVPLSTMPGSELIAADVAQQVLGAAGAVFVSVAIALSTFGTLNGSMMTGPRILFAMAEDGLLFRRLAEIDPRYGTPRASIIVSAVLGAVFVSVQTFSQLADLFVIGIWPFYALGVLAVFVMRVREPDTPRPYRAFGYPIVPALFLLSALYLLGNYLIVEPGKFVGSIGFIVLGVPIYYIVAARRHRAG